MWSRKEIKRKAKEVLKDNYWTAVAICFLIALLTGEFRTSIIGIYQSDDSMNPYYIVAHPNTIFENEKEKNDFFKRQEEIVNSLKQKKKNMSDIEIKFSKIIELYLDSMTKSQKYIFKILDGIESVIVEKESLAISLFIMSIVSIVFSIFIANPLMVALRRYFYKARDKSSTKINVIFEVFKKENWINISITMLLKDIFLVLWFITIIGGFIKLYEYLMIPYILADNPKIKSRKAFRLSKKMMKGNKFKVFILDVSFLGWYILSIFTFGLLNVFYVNPYRVATNVELYTSLKKKAIEEKIEYCEELK